MVNHYGGKISFKVSLLISFLVLFFAGLVVVPFLKHHVPARTVVKVVIEGEIVDEPRAGFPLFSSQTETLEDLLITFDTAARDPRVAGVVVEIKPFDTGYGSLPVFAKIQELRNAIQEVNQAGKWTAAYLFGSDDYGVTGVGGYYLASACKEIFISPMGMTAVSGVYLKSTFLRGLLDKIGIKPELQHIGAYKTASNTFTEKKTTAAQKEMDSWMVDDLYDQLVSGISASRHIPEKSVISLMDKGILDDAQSIKGKLVDEESYPGDFKEALNREHGRAPWMSWKDYMTRAAWRYWGRGEKIAIVYACGTIAGDKSGYNLFLGKTMGWETMSRAFKEIRKDPSIKAVVFRINSPGGDAATSDFIRHAAQLTAQKIPVVVSMSDVAGSGGYWIATLTPSPVIVADPATWTASIGVIGGKFNLSQFYHKLGINFDATARGKMALLWSTTDAPPGEKALFQRMIEHVYQNFLGRVAESRKMKESAVDNIGRGKVFTGKEALQRGLVDQLGGLMQAIAVAKEKAGIKASSPVDLIVYPKPRTVLQAILENLQGGSHISLGWPWGDDSILTLMTHGGFPITPKRIRW